MSGPWMIRTAVGKAWLADKPSGRLVMLQKFWPSPRSSFHCYSDPAIATIGEIIKELAHAWKHDS